MKPLDNEKPSERILFALQALEEFEQADNTTVNMQVYHGDDPLTGECMACLGGAAALKRWGIKPCSITSYSEYRMHSIGNEVYWYELSLDAARIGEVGIMFQRMQLEHDEGEPFCQYITPYRANRSQFFADMCQLASDLKRGGY